MTEDLTPLCVSLPSCLKGDNIATYTAAVDPVMDYNHVASRLGKVAYNPSV